jgi:thiamine transport system permease protein
LIVLLLGGGPRFTTVEVAVYQAVKVELDLPLAARLAVIQMIGALTMFLFLARPAPELAVASEFFPLYPSRPLRWALGLSLAILVWAPVLVLMVSGIFALPKLDWPALFVPVLTSLRLAVIVGLFSTLLALGFVCGKHPLIPWICSLPVSFSTILTTVALMLTYPETVQHWRGSLFAIAVVQSTAALPLVYRALHDGLSRIPPTLLYAARSLGAGPLQVFWRVQWPLLRPSVGLGFLLAAAFSLGEVGTVLMFLSDDLSTIPLEIYRGLGAYRFEAAHALGVVLLVVIGALFWAVEKLESWRS